MATTPTDRSNWPATSSSADGDAADAERGGDVQDAGQPARVAAGRLDREEREHEHQADQRREAGPGQRPPQHPRPAAVHAAHAGAAGASEEDRRSTSPAVSGGMRGRRQRGLLDERAAQCPRRPAGRGEARCAASGVEQPADPVVGVPGPPLHRPRVPDAVPDDPRRVAGHLQGPAARPGVGRSGWFMTVTPIVSTAVQSGRTSMRVISPSATRMSSWCACRPSRRLSDRRPSPSASIRPWCSSTPPWSSRTSVSSRGPPVPMPRSRARPLRVLVGGRLPGHRDLRRPSRLQQHAEGGGQPRAPVRAPAPPRPRPLPPRTPHAGPPRLPAAADPARPNPCGYPAIRPDRQPPKHPRRPFPDARSRADRRPVGRRGQGQGHRPARWARPLRRPLPGRQQRRPHGDHPGRREVRAAPDPVGHPDAGLHAGHRQRRRHRPRGADRRDRRPGGAGRGHLAPDHLRGRAPDHAAPPGPGQGHRALPGQAQDRHHRPRHRPRLRRQGRPHRHPRAGPAGPRDPAAEARGHAAGEEPDPGQGLQPQGHRRRRGRRGVRRLRRAAQAPHRRHPPAAGQGARRRRVGAARGLAGHPARRRPRHVSVRHVVQPDRRRRGRRRRHRPDPHRARRRHPQGLHDPGRLGPVPDRAVRRSGASTCASRAASSA